MAAVKKSVSVKDVARLAGVSEQTVSRTVHDSPSVRPETKERVRAAMRELGYRPNFAGRSLRRGRFKTVGVAMFNITGTATSTVWRALPPRPTNMAMPSPSLK